MALDKQESQDSQANLEARWKSEVEGTNNKKYHNTFPDNSGDSISGTVHARGGTIDGNFQSHAEAAGVQNFTQPGSPAIDGNTMMAEASVGKVRFAGLGYMLQQDGILDMQDNAKVLFSEPGFADFLEEKYASRHGQGIGETMQSQILQSFPEDGDNKDATLTDLTAHYAGVGDLTRAQLAMVEQNGFFPESGSYDFPTLLAPKADGYTVPRGEDGRPKSQNAPHVKDEDLPEAKYGAHQYSNLGYMMFAEAMEYRSFQKTGEMESYKDLMDAYMLHPSRGRAEGSGLSFNSTKFPENIDFDGGDNVAVPTYIDGTGQEVNAGKLTAAYAAGGMFASANDSAKFFNEFFKGFPETEGYGTKDANPFFSDKTIQAMTEAWQSRPAGIDKRNNYQRYQAPGFSVSVDGNGKVVQYDKGGETPGNLSMMVFDPQNSVADIKFVQRENLTASYAKEAGVVDPQTLMDAYQKDGKFDRTAMYNDYKENGVDALKSKVTLKAKVAEAAKGMGNNVSVSDAKEIEAQKTPKKGSQDKGMGF